MKIWTYLEMSTKVLTDLDMLDETFIGPNELAGYFNEGLAEAEAEIMGVKEDYFRTVYFMPLAVAEMKYELPFNIYANKIRQVVYRNGSQIYEVMRMRRPNQFLGAAFSDQYGSADDYQYTLFNDVVGQAKLRLYPASREASTLAASVFSSNMWMYYIRNVSRVPLIAAAGSTLGEFCNPELVFGTSFSGGNLQTAAGFGANNGIPQQLVVGSPPGSIAYVVGDAVKFAPGTPGSALPDELTYGVVYYVIDNGAGLIGFAETLADAYAGVSISITETAVGTSIMTVAATAEIRDATLIDIPEFATFVMQWVKCRCAEKQGNPNIDNIAATLVQQKQQMVSTLTEAVEDDNTTIPGDFSHYEEMN